MIATVRVTGTGWGMGEVESGVRCRPGVAERSPSGESGWGSVGVSIGASRTERKAEQRLSVFLSSRYLLGPLPLLSQLPPAPVQSFHQLFFHSLHGVPVSVPCSRNQGQRCNQLPRNQGQAINTPKICFVQCAALKVNQKTHPSDFFSPFIPKQKFRASTPEFRATKI